MVMYSIKVVKKKKKRKQAIILLIITIILLCLAVFGGIKLAEHKHLAGNNNPIDFTGQNDKNQVNNKEPNESNNQNNENNQLIENNNEENGQNNVVNNEEAPSQNEPSKNVNIQKLTNEQINSINNIYKSNTKRVFLTFDDGPSSAVTPDILDVLKNENIKATFFVLGTMVKSNPEIIKRERLEGHYIANHGYSHVYKKVYENENKPLEEYKKTNDLIQKALNDNNYQSNVFRFPGGSNGGYYDDIKTKAKQILKKNGVAYLDWNALTNDSAGATTEEEMLKNLKSTSKNKNSIVVLMHDAPNKKQTAKTLPKIIKYFRDNGYTFQNLYDIL